VLEVIDKHPRCARCFSQSHRVSYCFYFPNSKGRVCQPPPVQSERWEWEGSWRDYSQRFQRGEDYRPPVDSKESPQGDLRAKKETRLISPISINKGDLPAEIAEIQDTRKVLLIPKTQLNLPSFTWTGFNRNFA
jgi:hypothetical protein